MCSPHPAGLSLVGRGGQCGAFPDITSPCMRGRRSLCCSAIPLGADPINLKTGLRSILRVPLPHKLHPHLYTPISYRIIDRPTVYYSFDLVLSLNSQGVACAQTSKLSSSTAAGNWMGALSVSTWACVLDSFKIKEIQVHNCSYCRNRKMRHSTMAGKCVCVREGGIVPISFVCFFSNSLYPRGMQKIICLFFVFTDWLKKQT